MELGDVVGIVADGFVLGVGVGVGVVLGVGVGVVLGIGVGNNCGDDADCGCRATSPLLPSPPSLLFPPRPEENLQKLQVVPYGEIFLTNASGAIWWKKINQCKWCHMVAKLH